MALSYFDATAWANGTSPETCTATWAAGDEVLIWAFGENSTVTFSTPTATGLGTVSLVTSSTIGGECTAYLWRATASSAQTAQTISAVKAGGSAHGGLSATVIPGGVSSLTALTGSNTEATFSTAVGAGDGVAVGFGDFTATLGAGTPSTGSGTATERVEFVNTQYGVWIADWENTAAGTFGFGRSSYTGLAVAQVGAKWTPAGGTFEQEGARFGEDDANEAGHTWTAAQDTDITAALGSKLLRILLNATGDPVSSAPTLRYQKNGAGGYLPVPVGATTAPTLGTPVVGTVGVSAAAGTTVAPTYPTGMLSTDAVVLVLGQKPSTANGGTATTPSGFTLQGSLTGAGGYGATLGADTGNTNVFVYTKDAVTGSESGTLSVTVGTNDVTWAYLIRIPAGAAATFSYAFASGSDTTAGNVSIATGSMAIAAGDRIIAGMVIPTDVTTPSQFSAESLTQTGTTFGTVTELAEPDSATGNDIGGFLVQAPVSSGSGSGAVTLAATAGGTTTNVRGPGFVLRIRATGVTNELYVSTSANITAGGEATTARLTAPSGKSTSDFVTGRRWDDENGADSIDVTTDDYTEVEWCLTTQAPAANGDTFDFRAYLGSSPATAYTVTPRWTIGSGASNFPVSLSGSVSIGGALTRQTGKAVAGSVASSGGLTRRAGKALAGVVALSGAVTVTKVALRSFSGAVAISGVSSLRTGKVLSGSVASSGGLVRRAGKAVAGSVASAGAVTRRTGKAVGGVVAVSGVVSAVKLALLSLAGSVSISGLVSRRTGKSVAGSVASSGTATKQAQKALGGSVSVSGTLQRVKVALISLTGSVGVSGALVRQAGKSLAGGVASSGGLTRRTGKALAGAVGPSGALAASKAILRSFSGAVSISGVVTRRPGKALGGSVSSSGSLTKRTSKAVAGVVAISGAATVARALLRTFSGSVAISGTVTKRTQKALGGVVASAGTVRKLVAIGLAGELSPTGTVRKLISKTVRGVVSAVGGLTVSTSSVPTETVAGRIWARFGRLDSFAFGRMLGGRPDSRADGFRFGRMLGGRPGEEDNLGFTAEDD